LYRLNTGPNEAGRRGGRKEERVKRRTILAGAALLAAPLLALRALAPREPEFAFDDIPGLPGFRRLDGGGVSTPLSDPFAGLRAPGEPPPPSPLAPEDLCGALFGAASLAPGAVPVASFSDYYCPYCRDLTVRLAARAGPDLRVTWHELPLLGDASEAAARAALAADLQGAYPEFQARLLRAAFQPTEAYLTDLGNSLGIDPLRLIADARGEEVARRLAASARAAATLGIAATPALVVGRTLVSGAISDARLHALLARERSDGPPPC
jgi:predicted DsbA family dithiol-disulfide isomerase